MLDSNGTGQIDLNQLRQLLQEEYQTGESGASISDDVQVWLQIIEELEKDGERPITYTEYYDAILDVIYRGFADGFMVNQRRDSTLRQSIIL